MLDDSNATWRYAGYAALFLVCGIAYWWLGSQQSASPNSHAGARSDFDSLPPLGTLDSQGDSSSRRDLFTYAEPERPAVEEAPPPPPPVVAVEAPPPQIDGLADVKVIGLVRRGDTTSVFVQAGSAIRSVRVGDHFGEQNTLAVKSVQGRDVTIVDSQSNASKIYTLSEE
jgi:hypothetical protein